LSIADCLFVPALGKSQSAMNRMYSETIPLRFAGGAIARIRELTGRDEYSVFGVSTANAIDLLSGLIEAQSDRQSLSIQAIDLVAADRDQVLAAVYRTAFGDRIESTLTCDKCAQPFDIDFSLQNLIASINQADEPVQFLQLEDGSFQASNGVTFRLPTGRDELAATGQSAQELESLLLKRCTDEQGWTGGGGALEDLLERVAPLIDLELIATCPECRHVHKLQFDIQTYLLGALVAERRRLLSDINCIAAAYSWSLEEILSLTRSDRRHLVELIENEYAA
jgi:hypothetical protein